MKQGRILVLGVVLAFAVVAGVAEGAAPVAEASEDTSARALAVYEEGKVLYDARDYAGALARFDEAAELEPGKARWQYNRGLALRKLGRIEEAREALLHSRTLDFSYKQAEIDDKLAELGSARSEQASTSTSWMRPLMLGGLFCGGLFVVWRLWRRRSKPTKRTEPRSASVPAEDLVPLETTLRHGALMLIQVEHALRSGEDADLRALLNQATQAEQRAWQTLEQARYGSATLDLVQRQVEESDRAARAASEMARERFPQTKLPSEAEFVGCYFCARPLANADFRKRVPLRLGAQVVEVLACPPCANMAAAGQPPPVKVRRLHGGQFQHWSEMLGYDPYTHRHQPFANTTTVPAWEYKPSRPLAEVAALAAGGAVATGFAAYGVSELLDLDSASEEAAAQAVTKAAVRKARERREEWERDWKDHS